MTLRRAFGALVWALLLHLNLVASDVVCERHHDDSRATATAPMSMSHTSHSDVMRVNDLDRQQSCETPAIADCCRLMASCTVTLGLSEKEPSGVLPIERVVVAGLTQKGPTPLARPPELPPPKA